MVEKKLADAWVTTRKFFEIWPAFHIPNSPDLASMRVRISKDGVSPEHIKRTAPGGIIYLHALRAAEDLSRFWSEEFRFRMKSDLAEVKRVIERQAGGEEAVVPAILGLGKEDEAEPGNGDGDGDEEVGDEEVGGGETSADVFNDAEEQKYRAGVRLSIAKAAREELKVAQEAGGLIRLDTFLYEVSRLTKEFVAAMQRVPDAVAASAAAMDDEHHVRILLEKEIDYAIADYQKSVKQVLDSAEDKTFAPPGGSDEVIGLPADDEDS